MVFKRGRKLVGCLLIHPCLLVYPCLRTSPCLHCSITRAHPSPPPPLLTSLPAHLPLPPVPPDWLPISPAFSSPLSTFPCLPLFPRSSFPPACSPLSH